ncbi:MAG: hypothetical protein O7G87_11115 [bacterium]|nr:hypothetical protein [bacterium]
MADTKNVGQRLDQALLFAEERDQVLGALRRVGQLVLSTLDLDQILDRMSEEIILRSESSSSGGANLIA